MMNPIKVILRPAYYPLKRAVDIWGYKAFVKESEIQVRNTAETIDYILTNQVSVSRFGDGEYMVMNHGGNGFQNPNEELGKRLKEVLNARLPDHIVCLPYAFVNVEHMTADAKSFWYPFCGRYKDFILKITDSQKVYYDTKFTRFYMDVKNKLHVGRTVERLKKIWDGRDLFIIEGEYSCLGIGNNLFDNTRSIQRIIAPSRNAFLKYDQILETAVKMIPKNALVLSALGMTATVLCYDLAKLGYWAIDIGHVDIEYSWFRMGAKKKCPISGKAVNEINASPEKECNAKVYRQSIIAVVK